MAYIKSVAQLRRIANTTRSEEDKVGHLLKGIGKDVYNFLTSKDQLITTADVIQHCRTFEVLKMRRVTINSVRLANFTTVAAADIAASADLAEIVRRTSAGTSR